MTNDVTKQFRLQLNTFEQRKNPIARFRFEPKHYGASHNGLWVSIVTLTWITESLAEAIPIGTTFEGRAGTLAGANDAASEPMVALFRSNGFEPKIGKASAS